MSQGMTVFITGASAGFGAAIARRFAKDGARLVVTARRLDKLQALQAELGGPGRAHAVALDVTDRAAVERVFASLPKDFAAIDVLVNNAGLARGLDPAQKASLDDWDQMVDTNVKGLMYCSRTVLPGMIERGRGHIVNLGSTAGTYPYPGGNVYCSTKAFVHQFTLTLRADLLGTPVRMTVIEAGLCGGTEFSEVRFHGDKEKAASVYAGTQPIMPEDIAETAHWVATLPAHVNINVVEMMPVCQAFGPLAVSRSQSPSR
jgi:3-hydroxy acid dehydrogenase/malonic semialdehyde reductase